MFEQGDRVVVTHPETRERVEATFLSQGAPEQASGKHPYDEMRAA